MKRMVKFLCGMPECGLKNVKKINQCKACFWKCAAENNKEMMSLCLYGTVFTPDENVQLKSSHSVNVSLKLEKKEELELKEKQKS